MSSEESPGRPKWLVILIVGLPAWLIVSAVVGIWHKAKKENAPEAEPAKLLVQQISTSAVADDLKKLVDWIGERNGAGEDAAEGLRRTGSWIEGSLGPGNVGHTVGKIRGPAGFPLFHAIQPGSDPKEPALWVLAGYDSRQGSPGVEANGTGVSAVLAACRAITGDVTKASIHYLFLPHVYDEEGPVLETASATAELIRSQGTAGRVLVVEAMGSGPSLWLSSRAPEIIPEALAEGLGGLKGAEVVCLGEDTDLASILFEMGLPGIRVSTRPLVTAGEDDSAPADPVKVAAASENLLQFIRRCAQNP